MVSAVSNANANPTPTANRYPENWSAIVENKDGRYTTEQQQEASKKLNEREWAAFGHLASSGSTHGIKDFLKAYIKHVQSLSPEEQQSDRYRGTVAAARAQLAQTETYITANRIPDIRGSGGKSEEIGNPLIAMLKKSAEEFEKMSQKAIEKT